MIIIVFIHHIKVETIFTRGDLTTFATLGMDLAKVYLYVRAASYVRAYKRMCIQVYGHKREYARNSTTFLFLVSRS